MDLAPAKCIILYHVCSSRMRSVQVGAFLNFFCFKTCKCGIKLYSKLDFSKGSTFENIHSHQFQGT
jgi:hypothetical protein